MKTRISTLTIEDSRQLLNGLWKRFPADKQRMRNTLMGTNLDNIAARKQPARMPATARVRLQGTHRTGRFAGTGAD